MTACGMPAGAIHTLSLVCGTCSCQKGRGCLLWQSWCLFPCDKPREHGGQVQMCGNNLSGVTTTAIDTDDVHWRCRVYQQIAWRGSSKQDPKRMHCADLALVSFSFWIDMDRLFRRYEPQRRNQPMEGFRVARVCLFLLLLLLLASYPIVLQQYAIYWFVVLYSTLLYSMLHLNCQGSTAPLGGSFGSPAP